MNDTLNVEYLDKLNGFERLTHALVMIDHMEDSSLWNDDRDDAANEILRIARVALRKEKP